MKKLKLNLCVVNANDGGELMLEELREMESDFKECFRDGLEEDEWNVVTLENGLKELDDYFSDYGDRDEEEVKEWKKLKEDYVSMIGDKKGKFYVWGVEYDCELMFIED